MTIFSRDLDDAIMGPISAAVPGVVIGHCLVVHYMDMDGEEQMIMAAPSDQRLSHTSELLSVGMNVVGELTARKVEEWIDDEY